jgi:putative ABC transport system permease protein
MKSLRAWLLRLAGVFDSTRQAREFDEELESHLQFEIERHLALGMTPEEARRRAMMRFGGLEQTKEQYRDQLGLPALETLLQDIRGGIRLMRRTPSFTAIAIVTLAIGVGANTVMFSVVNTVLLRPLPYADPERLVYVETLENRGEPWGTAPPDFYRFRRVNRTFDFLDAFYETPINLTGHQTPERVNALVASSGFFAALGVPPALGRGFIASDEQWGSHRVIVLGDGLWKTRFASDPSIVGRAINVNGDPFVVVGVMAPGFTFLNSTAQAFIPMAFEAGDNMNTHSNFFLTMIGRLRQGVDAASAGADMNLIARDIAVDHPETKGTTVRVAPLRDALVRDARRPVLVLLGAVALVLLISCVNLANLLLARGAARAREIALRTAIGASRGRLVRQLLTESLVLASAGAAAGLLVTYGSIDALNLVSRGVLPRAEDIRIDNAVLLFTLATAFVTGLLFGLVPALRTTAVDLHEGLKDANRAVAGAAGTHRLRNGLVVAEVALSLTLLIGAGLMVKSIYRLLHAPAGFDAESVLTMQVTLPAQQYVDKALERRFSPLAYTKSTRFFTEAVDRIRTIPGVQAVGAISGLPLMGDNWAKRLTLYDRPLPADFRGLPVIQYRVVSGDFFRAMGIRLVSGRAFRDGDTLDAPKVAIVNRALVRQHFGDENPIGKIIGVNPPLELLPENSIKEARAAGLPEDYAPDKLEIVGVAEDVRYAGLGTAANAVVYAPYSQGSEGAITMFLAVRTATDPGSIAGVVRERISQVDANLPVSRIATMEERVSASVTQPRLQAMVLGLFAAMAMVLAVIGIYGVISYSVAQRSREIGIRVALGARRAQVLGMVLRQALVLVSAGLAFGVVAALAMTRVLQNLLYEVSTTDPFVFTALVLALGVTGTLAATVPARRAAHVDPVATLRAE